MVHTVFAVDPRWKNPQRQGFLKDALSGDLELVIPESYETEDLLRELEPASAIVTGLAPITADMMRAAPNLRVVGKAGTGVDSIDVEAATAMKIPVAHAPGWMRASPVAEHALTMMLLLSRKPWLWRGEERPPLGDGRGPAPAQAAPGPGRGGAIQGAPEGGPTHPHPAYG